MSRKGRVIGILWLVAAIFFFVAQAAQFEIIIPFAPVGAPKLVAVYGTPIEQKDLDGVIGAEWDDAQKQEMLLGKYRAVILLKQDGKNLYIGMVIKTYRRFSKGFEGYVVFDNGDGRDYYRGDDIISVLAKNGRLLAADCYYWGKYDIRLDTKVGGQNNAYGAGKYDPENRSYVFEFVKELASGDIRDIPLNTGDSVTTIYGWASY